MLVDDKQAREIAGCSDMGCLIKKPEGQHTNGGQCYCSQSKLRKYIHFLKSDVESLSAQVAELKKDAERSNDLLIGLADMWEDRHKPEEYRTYIPGAFSEEMETVIKYAKTLAAKESGAQNP